ncbi:hypothetical protein ACIPLR_23660 [Herbaspirillum huttiense]|uniref:hypothetical protein n=1 Tax=Herbaspirillum huttiense TaxID=863372 RepID=UPI0012FF282D|nr:hypothetical protein [Herbaspirillum huttiense]
MRRWLFASIRGTKDALSIDCVSEQYVRLTGFLVIVLILAWLLWKPMPGGGFGFLGNLAVGVVGDFLFR